ncbi:MAG: GNAT family N-acetyltransferase [Bacillota bacterium]|jgi:predicted acetyltransferase
MDFRIAQKSDTEKIKELWSYSFESYEPYYSWYFDTVYQPDLTLCCYDDEVLAASLQLAPYKMMLRGKELDLCYMVGVISAAPYRNRGVAAKLMQYAYTHLRNKGFAYSALLPVAPDFYRKTSFTYTYKEHRYKIKLRDLRPIAKSSGHWHASNINEQTISFMEQVYRKMTASQNGYIIRNHKNWQNFLEEHVGEGGRIALLTDETKNPAGYLLYQFKDQLFEVREMGYINRKAQKSAFHFILTHQNEAENFFWAAPASDCSYLELSSQEGIFVRPFVMSRVLDPVAALQSISYPEQVRGSAIIKIVDQQITENNLILLIKTHDGKMNIDKCPPGTLPHITLEISALTSLIWGYLSVEQLVEQVQTITGYQQPLSFLAALFPPCSTWINEHT